MATALEAKRVLGDRMAAPGPEDYVQAYIKHLETNPSVKTRCLETAQEPCLAEVRPHAGTSLEPGMDRWEKCTASGKRTL